MQVLLCAPTQTGDTSPKKYILKFTSEQISQVTFTFLIVVPVNLSEIGIKRWCAHLDVLDYRLPRFHSIAVVNIKEAYVYCGDIDYMTEDEMINLPSELTPGEVRPWSPGLLRERVMSRGHATWLRKVKTLTLTVPRRFNVANTASNADYYFMCTADFQSGTGGYDCSNKII
jgi:hypothetical protein